MFRKLERQSVALGLAALLGTIMVESTCRAAEWRVVGDGIFPTGADMQAAAVQQGFSVCWWGGPDMFPTRDALVTSVNGFGIKTNVVRETNNVKNYKQITYSTPFTGWGGAKSRMFNRNVFEAKFSHTLLKEGTNRIEPMTWPPGMCMAVWPHFVDATLYSPEGRETVLSRFDRNCLMCNGNSSFSDFDVELTLGDIHPGLVRYLENFQEAIMKDREMLVANAADIADLAGALDRLDMAETEIQDLVSRGLDELTPEYLNEVLQRYQDLPPESRDALVKLIEDRHKDIVELRAEIDSITAAYNTFEDRVVGLLGNTLAGASFDPEHVDNFLPPSLEDIPGVSVPIGSGAAFDPARDPYKAHANKVITTLRSYTANGKVVARAAYISLVRQWSRNQKALEASLQGMLGRTVSNAEYAAFLTARGQVRDEISGYLDVGDWFKDCPVPESLRALVDGHLMRKDAEVAVALKTSGKRRRSPTNSAL